MAETIDVVQVVRPAEGGIQTHVVGLTGRLPEARFSTIVAGAMTREFQLALTRELLSWVGIDIPGEPSVRRIIDAAGQLRRLIAGREADIVHAHGYLAGLTAAWALRGLEPRPKLVLTAHVFPKEKPSFLQRWAYRWLFARIDRGIAVSTAIAEAVRPFSPSEEQESLWSVIHNGIDSRKFGRRVDPGVKRGEMGVDPSAAVVGVVARLAREKGVDVFLRAAGVVAEDIPNVDFIIVGDGPLREDLENLAHELGLSGQTVFMGRRRDVAEILTALDLLVVPSREESFGLAALEGVAAGITVVASEVPGLREVLGEAEDVARFVPPDDPQALAQVIVAELNRVSLEDEADAGAMIPLAAGDMATLAEALVSETEFNLDKLGLDRETQEQAKPELTERQKLLQRFDIRHMVDATVDLYEDLARKGDS